ncbi:hypothetical protein BDR04DRAFT_703589 [Suillus decipiens]|nr:hypothetical protein BDR04DRAFT_703589 [Suillus decipiens]
MSHGPYVCVSRCTLQSLLCHLRVCDFRDILELTLISQHPVDNQNGPTQVFPSCLAYLFVTETIGYSRSFFKYLPRATGQWFFSYDRRWYDYSTKLALPNLKLYNQTDAYPRPDITIDIYAYLPKS